MDLPAALDDAFWHEVHEFDEEKRMPFLTTLERIGMKKGLRKGIELGLKLKFRPEGLRLLSEVHGIAELDKLEAVLQAIEAANSPDELRRVWAP